MPTPKPVNWRRVAKRLIMDIDVARRATIDVEQGDEPAGIRFIKLTFARVTLENAAEYANRATKRERKSRKS